VTLDGFTHTRRAQQRDYLAELRVVEFQECPPQPRAEPQLTTDAPPQPPLVARQPTR